MATNTPTGERLRLAELIQRREFQCLTPKQQNFVSRLISSGLLTGTYDALDAVMFAYKTSVKTATIFSYELMGNRRIKRVLDLHFRRTEFESILEDLGRAVRLSIERDMKRGGTLSVATVDALKFYEKYAGRKLETVPGVASQQGPEVKSDKKTFAVGDHVWQGGVEYIVTKLKTDGTVDDADPVEAEHAVR